MKNRNYQELSRLKTYEERFDYLRLDGQVGIDTFGHDRYLNQALYMSSEWQRVRNEIIIRDNACDLGIEGYDILGYYDKDKRYHKPKIYIHHMMPITKEQILDRDPIIFDSNYLISCTLMTHNAIHYGNKDTLPKGPIERKPNDTCPWKR